jgi:hypothetical protein
MLRLRLVVLVVLIGSRDEDSPKSKRKASRGGQEETARRGAAFGVAFVALLEFEER